MRRDRALAADDDPVQVQPVSLGERRGWDDVPAEGVLVEPAPGVQLLDARLGQLDAERLRLGHGVVVDRDGDRVDVTGQPVEPGRRRLLRRGEGPLRRRRRTEPDAVRDTAEPAAEQLAPERRPAVDDRRPGPGREPAEDLLAADLTAPAALLAGPQDHPVLLRHAVPA